jgi:hypothetical protein
MGRRRIPGKSAGTRPSFVRFVVLFIDNLLTSCRRYGYIFDSLTSPSGTEQHKRDNEGGSNLRLRSGGEDGNIVQFYDIVRQGALQPDSRGKFTGAKGFERNWDGCSGTVSGACHLR